MSAGALEPWELWHLAAAVSAAGGGCSAGSGRSESEELRQWLPVCWACWPWSFTESYSHTHSSC